MCGRAIYIYVRPSQRTARPYCVTRRVYLANRPAASRVTTQNHAKSKHANQITQITQITQPRHHANTKSRKKARKHTPSPHTDAKHTPTTHHVEVGVRHDVPRVSRPPLAPPGRRVAPRRHRHLRHHLRRAKSQAKPSQDAPCRVRSRSKHMHQTAMNSFVGEVGVGVGCLSAEPVTST